MNKELIIPTGVLKEAILDLQRPHEFAFERIGFFLGIDDGKRINITEWFSIEDHHYIETKKYGALIGETGMHSIMQKAFSTQASMFHFHLHEFQNLPNFSAVDLNSLREEMIPSLYNFSKKSTHGGIIKGKKGMCGIYFLKDSNDSLNLTIQIGEENGK